MHWEKVINYNINWLEFFKVFENIDSVLDKEFKKIRIDSKGWTLLLFFTFIISHTFDVLLWIRYNTERRDIPTIPYISLNNLIWIKLLLHKYYFFIYFLPQKQLFECQPLYLTLIRKSWRWVALISYYWSYSWRIWFCGTELMVSPKGLKIWSNI